MLASLTVSEFDKIDIFCLLPETISVRSEIQYVQLLYAAPRRSPSSTPQPPSPYTVASCQPPHIDPHPHPHRYLHFIYDMFSSLCAFTAPVSLLNRVLGMPWTDPKAHAQLVSTFGHDDATCSEGEDADHQRSVWLMAFGGLLEVNM